MLKNFYNKHILPKFLDFSMRKKELENFRPSVVGIASGIVLEIGFGSGLNLPYYKNVTKLYALEPSAELYKIAQKEIKNVSFPVEHLQVSAEKIPLPDNSVDSVVSTWTLCTIPRPEIALKEILRVLKPGGKFSFIEHGKSPKNFTAKLQKWLTPVSKFIGGGCHLDREIDRLIREAGFNIQKMEQFREKFRPLLHGYKGVCKKLNT